MADAVIQVLVENASSLLQKEIGLLSGVEKDVESLSSKLSTIRNFLEDAEERQFTDDEVDVWLRKLKNVAYDVDDVLDEFKTEVERLEYKRSSTNKVRASLTKLNPKFPIFRHKIGSQLNQLQQKLDEIVEEGNDFNLQARIANRRWADGVIQRRITGYLLNKNEIHGREGDREKIVKCLLENAADSADIFVYPIVGMGGLGKTTLAHMIFQDDRIKPHFEQCIWVCVSEVCPQNDFDVKSVISAIIEFLSGTRSEVSNLASLHKRLRELLIGKRYLLVLDDVWGVDRVSWEALKCALSCGSCGSSVIVTTRLDTVAKIMGTFQPHNLSLLSDDDCWLLFKQQAFEDDAIINQNIISIAKEIAQKCKGVPLVAKTLGGLLRSTSSEIEWKTVRDNELRRLSNVENPILPMLRLSYRNLPSDAKRCFTFCAVFPKDLRIRTNQLIHLWMANGFISSTEELDVEDVGNQMCTQLACASLIQDLQVDGLNNIQSFKMHDLVCDFARVLVQDEISFKEEKNTQHLNLSHSAQPFCLPNSEYRAASLRTLLFTSDYQFSDFPHLLIDDGCASFIEDGCVSFSKFQKARAIVARGISSKPLSPSIGNLKYLRHLDFSHSKFELLPKSICEFWNLQILDLTDCRVLQGLPRRTRRLKNLWYLYLNGCDALKYSPPRLGEIIGLKILNLFVVGKSKGCGISELGHLNLKGELHIRHLERVRKSTDAKKAGMVQKQDLRILILSWDMSSVRDEDSEIQDSEILEALKPHPNLEQLKINGYKGTLIPPWMGHSHYEKLVSIKLSDIEKWSGLSLLGKLPFLNQLEIQSMKCMKYVDDGENHSKGAEIFPYLEKIRISDSESLQRLSKNEGKDIFPRLTHMYISTCPELVLSNIPSVSELVANECSESFLDSISNLRNLTSLSIGDIHEKIEFSNDTFKNLTALKSLKISGCGELESLPESGLQDLQSLECLKISGCRNFKFLSSGFRHLTALETLFIYGCPELRHFPLGLEHLVSLKSLSLNGISILGESKLDSLPEALQHIPNLASLEIYDFPNLTSLPEWLGKLTSLQTLRIMNCKKLRSLPESMKNLEKLQSLFLLGCGQKLRKRCQKENGKDWRKIAHIPNMTLKNGNVLCN